MAGIADQPLQGVIAAAGGAAAGGAAAASRPGGGGAASRVSGLVSGVGKGLVGVVTKPIGGAAELVSQTGEGSRGGGAWGRRAASAASDWSVPPGWGVQTPPRRERLSR